MTILQEIAHSIRDKVKNFDYSTNNHQSRVILSLLLISFVFSGFSIMSSRAVIKADLRYIEQQYIEKRPELMKVILLKCQGNLYDPNVVKQCIGDSKEKLVQPLVDKLSMTSIKLTLWFIFFGAAFSYYGLMMARQKLRIYNKNQEHYTDNKSED